MFEYIIDGLVTVAIVGVVLGLALMAYVIYWVCVMCGDDY